MNVQCRTFLAINLFALCFTPLRSSAQTIQERGANPEQTGNTAVLQTSTQLVVLDVIVQDKNGNAVHGLSADNFRIVENKDSQTIRRFEEHNNTVNVPESIVRLRPGEFTNFTPVKGTAPLNILLVDQINTAPGDQLYLHDQLQKYIDHSTPNARIAIIGMRAGKLSMLQGFTSDPALLRDAIDNRLRVGQASPVGSAGFDELRKTMEQVGGYPPGTIQHIAEAGSDETKIKIALSLDCFDQLARYLAYFPGRKNLIWFSGSFPLSIMPDATLANDLMGNPFAVMGNAEAQYRRVTNTLTRAQVAIYPVDARGVRLENAIDTSPLFNVAHPDGGSGPTQTVNGHPVSVDSNGTLNRDQQRTFSNDVNDHNTMDRMADDTGGKSFYANNDLGLAVRDALESGSNYYTLDYSPTNRKWDDRFRNVHVELTGAAAARGLKLTYRKGYYADAPTQTYEGKSTTALVNKDESQVKSSVAYARASLTHGTPEPTEMLFKARVLPSAAQVEQVAVFGNHMSPNAKGPFRRYSIDVAAIASNFDWQVQPDGQRIGAAEFGVLVYDKDGRLLNRETKAYQLHATPDEYQTLLKEGVQVHEEVSAPVKGDIYFRIAIHDLYGDKYGVVEVPASRVAQLQSSPSIVPELGARPLPK